MLRTKGLCFAAASGAARTRRGSRHPKQRRSWLLPGAHAICGAFIKLACSYNCLDASSFHIVSNGITQTDKSNANAHCLQPSDETKQFVCCTNVDEVDRSTIQQHALHIWPRGQ